MDQNLHSSLLAITGTVDDGLVGGLSHIRLAVCPITYRMPRRVDWNDPITPRISGIFDDNAFLVGLLFFLFIIQILQRLDF